MILWHSSTHCSKTIFLENIVLSEVYIALRKDFKDDPNRFGAGTAEDPYDGSKTAGGVYKFDTIMSSKVGPNTTIYLGPGVFETLGSHAWSAQSGQRIVGGGWAGANASGTTTGATVLKLQEHADAEDNYAVSSASFLDGFELAYLSIDCNMPNENDKWAGAIDINGSHIRVHHVRIFNFGCRSTADVVFGVVHLCRPVSQDCFDCVMSDCVFENPSTYSNSHAFLTCIYMDSLAPGYYNRACVLRNNYIDCTTTGGYGEFRGIWATGGVGIIVELNRIFNVTTGILIAEGDESNLPATKDLILRDNFLYNVTTGISLHVDESRGG
jgi:hypothetical protein